MPATLRKSLMALAVAAVMSSVNAQADALDCFSDETVGCQIAFITSDILLVDSDPSLSGDHYGLYAIMSTISTLENRGSIDGGFHGVTLWLSAVDILNNSGTIYGGRTAIHLDGLAAPLTINHTGGIIAADIADINNFYYAIEASLAGRDVTLNWSGGSIEGGLRHLKVLNLELDHATLHGGHLTMASGSTLRMKLTSDNSQPVLTVGNYSFGSGSQLLLRPSADNFSVDNQTYTLIMGQGNANSLLTVASESPFLTVHSATLIDGITATVSIAAQQQVAENISLAGGSVNAQRVGSAIAPLLASMQAANSDDPVLTALSGSRAVLTTEQLVPDVNGGVLHAAQTLGHLANLNAAQRTQGLRGASAGDAFVERGLWLKALSSNAEQDARGGIEGFDAKMSGLALGVDGKLNEQLTLGLSYSYLNSDIQADGGNQTDIDGHAITLYSGYEQGAWFLDSSLTLGLDHNDSQRYIAGTTAKADYDSHLFGLNVLGGYGFTLDNGLLLEPRAAARYGRVDIDGFREKGSLAALEVGDQRYEVAELGAGLRLAGNLLLGQGTLAPQATLMAYHDFAADRIDTTASFVFGGSSFTSSGASPVRTRYEAGIGVDYRLAAMTLGLSYDYTGKESFSADTFQAKVRYDF